MTAADLERIARARWRVAVALTVATLVTYFGFILLVAFEKPLLGRTVTPGLSFGILTGAAVIVIAWALTGLYVRWANTKYDAELAAVREASKR